MLWCIVEMSPLGRLHFRVSVWRKLNVAKSRLGLCLVACVDHVLVVLRQ